jgi:hypothetical protein
MDWLFALRRPYVEPTVGKSTDNSTPVRFFCALQMSKVIVRKWRESVGVCLNQPQRPKTSPLIKSRGAFATNVVIYAGVVSN